MRGHRRRLLLLERRRVVAAASTDLGLSYANIDSGYGTLVGPSALAVLNGANDANYIQSINDGKGSLLYQVGTSPAVPPGPVTSWMINIRASDANGTGNLTVATSFGQQMSPLFLQHATTPAPTTYILGPFTKSGGGSLSPVAFSNMVFTVSSNNNNPSRLYSVSITPLT